MGKSLVDHSKLGDLRGLVCVYDLQALGSFHFGYIVRDTEKKVDTHHLFGKGDEMSLTMAPFPQ